MSLHGKKIALFLEDLYNEHEFWYPYYRMKEAGAEVTVIAPEKKTYSSKIGLTARADKDIESVDAGDYDALIIPGGYAPDYMRRVPAMVEFVRKMYKKGDIVASICHAGWMLASAGILHGNKMTGFFAIKDDMVNAGAEWVDDEVVKDGTLITSRTPDDLPAFCKTIIETLR